ncbi:MAG: 2,3-bisphosphoglycerate-independent phosphoglycerate mutase [Bacteroidota bacterium]
MEKKRAILIILDGWGHGPLPKVSAIAQAQTPFVDQLYQNHPHAELVTFGEDVGLPERQMGNSEVGHLNIGAGRVVYQELARINKAIREKTLHQHPVLLDALAYAKKEGKQVHLLGLVSDGGVHSHIQHLKALCDICEEQAAKQVFIHAFTDGRDTDPKGGKAYLAEVLAHIEGQQVELASIIGRYYAMDRDKRWERIQLAYDLLVKGKGQASTDPIASIAAAYDAGLTDEFLAPIVCTDNQGQPKAKIQADDVVIFFNFRTDRPRELTQALSQQDFPEYQMVKQSLYYVTMTRYDETYEDVKVVYNKEDISDTLGAILAAAGKSQLRIAETEKYPHVTFFFSGGREEAFPGERRIMIPSPKVATYDLQPEMSAKELTQAVTEDIEKHLPDFICLNYANTDMVGHTGVFAAAVQSAEMVDHCLKQLLEVAMEHHYQALIIADHGNSDCMVNPDGTPHTAHTVNLVPCIYVGPSTTEGVKLKNGRLADVAPTILSMLGMEQPEAMTGVSLLLGTEKTIEFDK